jgi:Leucine-rich repeat (LRR) protein
MEMIMFQHVSVSKAMRFVLVLMLAISTFALPLNVPVALADNSAPELDGEFLSEKPPLSEELALQAEQARNKGFVLTGEVSLVSTLDPFSCADVTSLPEAECEALVDLYNATNGADWFENSGWLISSDPCNDWYSVNCSEGHVRSLWLSANNLVGNVPSTIGDLSSLAYLGMAWNQLAGDLPAEFWTLSGLKYLNLRWNDFTGQIPEAISNYVNITDLDLSKNNFSGPTPSELWKLEGLTNLWLLENNFQGEIPADIGNLLNLTILDLSDNKFNGNLPDEIWSMSQLQSISVSVNQFSGQIPPEISNLVNLRGINLNDNQFSGNLPSEFWALPNLEFVALSNNQFTGEIPPEIGNLNLPRNLYLDHNMFTGPIPPELGNLTTLRTLNISSNQFKGEIPIEITNLVRLNEDAWDYTDIGYNQLYSNDPVVRAFLDEKDPDWESTQTPISGFMDVPNDYWASLFIAAVKNAGITGGCRPNEFCPSAPVYRGDMAIFLERGLNGPEYTPPAATGIFTDVPLSAYYAKWVEQLYADGITGGCSVVPPKYCPSAKVTRAQMAVFLLKAIHGADYSPPPAKGIFSDVQSGSFFEPWIEQLAAEGITAGCGVSLYCPSSPVTRAQMAVFLTRAFDLPMP